MANPRIVGGRVAISFGVRGHVSGQTFLIGIPRGVDVPQRPRVEDRLIEEAESLIRSARRANGTFNWEAHHFAKNAHDVWEKILSQKELENLLAG